MIACSHPGRMGDALYALPTIKKVCETRGTISDFYTSDYCMPLKSLFERQSYIHKFYIAPNYVVDNYGCGAQPWYVPMDSSLYECTYQLGFRYTPDTALHKFIGASAGVAVNKVEYEYDDFETLDRPYIVVAPRGQTTYTELFRDVVRKCGYDSVIIGGQSDYIGVGIDATGMDMLKTLTWISKAKAFVGIMSSQLVLANGFDIPKLVPHDGRSWDMRHVIYSDTNHYLVNPTAEEILSYI